MNIKLLTEQHLEFLSLKGGCKFIFVPGFVVNDNKFSNIWNL